MRFETGKKKGTIIFQAGKYAYHMLIFNAYIQSNTHSNRWTNNGCINDPFHHTKSHGRYSCTINAIYIWNLLQCQHQETLFYLYGKSRVRNKTKILDRKNFRKSDKPDAARPRRRWKFFWFSLQISFATQLIFWHKSRIKKRSEVIFSLIIYVTSSYLKRSVSQNH